MTSNLRRFVRYSGPALLAVMVEVLVACPGVAYPFEIRRPDGGLEYVCSADRYCIRFDSEGRASESGAFAPRSLATMYLPAREGVWCYYDNGILVGVELWDAGKLLIDCAPKVAGHHCPRCGPVALQEASTSKGE